MTKLLLSTVALCALLPATLHAEPTPRTTAILRGLAAVSALGSSADGRAALQANLIVTGAIQTGTLAQPTLLPFAAQQRQALRDAFITDANATGLADGLGSKLGAAYQAKASYSDYATFSSISPAVADLLAYGNETTRSDAGAGKFFFANGTAEGRTASDSAGIFAMLGGTPDVFGKAYGRPGGSVAADAYGNSRPFQTEPSVLTFTAEDYFGTSASNLDWLRGPGQNLTDSPSYPSGHTTYGYSESMMLAVLVPERYQQMVTRAAEYGNDRIILGAHYAMDVLGGRTLALHDIAHLLANDPAYVGRKLKNTAVVPVKGQTQNTVSIADFPAAVKAARDELAPILQAGCGDTLEACASQDTGRFKDAAANEAFYNSTQTYGLPVVHQNTATTVEDVAKIAPEAGHLLTVAFPKVTLDEANAILTATEGPGGGFLDDGSDFGLYSRLNLYAAAGKAIALSATR